MGREKAHEREISWNNDFLIQGYNRKQHFGAVENVTLNSDAQFFAQVYMALGNLLNHPQPLFVSVVKYGG